MSKTYRAVAHPNALCVSREGVNKDLKVKSNTFGTDI
jgi:hypothetical protein